METTLHLKRRWFGPKATIGELYVEEEIHRQCFTLEDTDRSGENKILEKGEKIDGATCIPTGKYQIVLDFSERFRRVLPRLINVPLFEGIRIHPGNTDKDTHGCILVGKTLVNSEMIGSSRDSFDILFGFLDTANKHGKIFITIENEPTKDIS